MKAKGIAPDQIVHAAIAEAEIQRKEYEATAAAALDAALDSTASASVVSDANMSGNHNSTAAS
jgi:hypothetical protein